MNTPGPGHDDPGEIIGGPPISQPPPPEIDSWYPSPSVLESRLSHPGVNLRFGRIASAASGMDRR